MIQQQHLNTLFLETVVQIISCNPGNRSKYIPALRQGTDVIKGIGATHRPEIRDSRCRLHDAYF